MNKVIISGRLTKDIEVKKTKDDKSYVSFSVAVDMGWGEKKKTIFPNVTAWEKTADFAAKYFHKGDQMIIEGSLNESEYERDGVKIKNVFVSAQNIEFGATARREESPKPVEIRVDDINADELPFY